MPHVKHEHQPRRVARVPRLVLEHAEDEQLIEARIVVSATRSSEPGTLISGRWIRSFLFVGPWCLRMCVPGVRAEKKACWYERGTACTDARGVGARQREFRVKIARRELRGAWSSDVVSGQRLQFSSYSSSWRKR